MINWIPWRGLVALMALTLAANLTLAEPARMVSHPPLRTAPPPANRPFDSSPAYFADAQKGDDKNDGGKDSPWRTIGRALKHLKAGDTLYLKSGVFFENVYVALHGKPDAPITIRSAPGEQAIIDGGLSEFSTAPAESWEPFKDGGPGEFRSRRSYPNLRDVLGSFGDSMIGLQTYYHAKDMRATNEIVDWENWDKQDQSDIKPLYCGPGLWYDAATGHIHLRLGHTHLPDPMPNYRGETDPRKLPLILAPFRSIPLYIDQARHVRFQDLIVCGAGYTAVQIDQAEHVEFDNVTVWCGTYGLRVNGTAPMKFLRSALHGNVAPWTFRNDGSKRDYPGRPHRNISRLNTHALLEIESGRESSVYAYPQNDQWEIAYCEFTDAHDALYLGSINVRFHHNLIENMQDDGLYLSPMYLRHRLEKTDPEIHIFQNLFRGMLTAVAFGGTEAETRDQIFLYRNIFDLRSPINTGRPTTRNAAPSFSTGKLMGDHGSPPWPAMNIYHNTFVMAEPSRDAAMSTLGGSKAGHPRRVFNNVFLHLGKLPGFIGPDPAANAVEDGNLYAVLTVDDKVAAGFFQRYRASEMFNQSKKLYPAGSSSHSRVAVAGFVKARADSKVVNDYRLSAGSQAIDKGVVIPVEWLDPLRKQDKGNPDVGALPLDTESLKVGRTAPQPQ